MTAWVWGIEPEGMRQTHPVRLWKSDSVNLQDQIKVTTTKLATLTQRKGFQLEAVVQPYSKPVHTSIFTLYRQLSKCDNDLQERCYHYAGNDIQRWWTLMEQIDKVRKQYDTYLCDYEQSMEIDKVTSFPATSSYVDNGNYNEEENWVWCRRGRSVTFAFDSEAERKWASVMEKLAAKGAAKVPTSLFDDDYRYLWGKNFQHNSEIKYEYYLDGVHASFPDFILKDRQGRVHIFEVKSVNKSASASVDEEDYDAKVEELKRCYKACSAKLPDHVFYLPVLKGETWDIFKYDHGEEGMTSVEQLREELQVPSSKNEV